MSALAMGNSCRSDFNFGTRNWKMKCQPLCNGHLGAEESGHCREVVKHGGELGVLYRFVGRRASVTPVTLKLVLDRLM